MGVTDLGALNVIGSPQENWIGGAARDDLVSVIIPTYNRSTLLQEALESVHEQTWRPLEVVVVDDGSTDDTADRLQTWQSRVEPEFEFRYFYQPNAGAPAARNLGTRNSTGEFIQYLDSDDLLAPDKIEAQVRYLQRESTVDGVFGDWAAGLPEESETICGRQDDDLLTQFLGSRCIALFAFLMRRGIVHDIGPWDESLRRNQEIDFHLRGVLAGGTFLYQQHHCGLWRLHPNGRIGGTAGTQSLYDFSLKWLRVLQQANELTPPRRRALSDALFHSATSFTMDDPELRLEMLVLSRRLFPERREFQTTRMRGLTALLGESLALRAWLWRASQQRRALRVNG